MKTLKKEIISNKFLLAFFLVLISCQKDYYLDDLNDALSEIDSLKSQNFTLNNQINQLNQLVNNLNTKNSNIQASFDELNNAYQNSLNTIAELNQKIVELTDLLRIEQAVNNSISDGYYLIGQVSYTINDSLIWAIDEIPKRTNFFLSSVAKVENGDITENYQLSTASSYWNNVNDRDILKYRTFPSRDYTYAKEFGDKMYINEYTGDSLPYYSNFKIIDLDVFTNELIYPTNSNGDRQIMKYAYHKLFSEEFEIIEGITYPPVVNIDQTNWNDVSQYNSFNDINNVFDYSSSSNFLSDSIYNMIDQSDPKSYLSAFIKDAERNGVDLSHVNPELLEIRPWYTPTDQYGRNVTAWGSITCSETNNRIGYDNGWFEGSFLTDNRFYKLKVMYHEFGHTVLGLKHTCAKNHIMTSGSSGNYPCNGDEVDEYDTLNNVNDFKRAVADLFSGYNQFYYDCYLDYPNINRDVE